MKKYLFEYNWNNKKYGFDVEANSISEAKEKVARMSFARYEGELVHSGYYVPGAGPFIRMIVWFRNLF